MIKLSSRGKAYILTLLFCTGLLIYSPAGSYSFLNLDDTGMLTENPGIQKPISESLALFLFEPHMNNWVPLTFFSYSVEYHLWGMNPKYFHWINIILHSANMVLVSLFLYLFLKLYDSRKKTPHYFNPSRNSFFLIAVFAGLIFGLHPQRVESVAWISSRKDVLFALFYLSSLIAYLFYLKRRLQLTPDQRAVGIKKSYLSNSFWWLCLTLFLLSGLSKGMAVSLPCVLLIIDWLLKRKSILACVWEKVPFIILSVWISFMTILSGWDGLTMAKQPLDIRLFNALASYGAYLEKFFIPMQLSPLNYYEADKPEFLPYIILTGISTVVILLVAFFKGGRLSKACILFFIITFLPVIGITQIGIQEYADRFTYIPSIVLCGFMSYLIFWLADLIKKRIHKSLFAYALIICLLGIPLVYYGVLTRHYLPVWRNSLTLWTRIYQTRPYPHAYEVLNGILLSEGRYQEASETSLQAINFFPNDPRPYYHLARSAYMNHDFALSNQSINYLIKKFPQFAETYLLMSKIISDPELSRNYYKKAIRLKPLLVLQPAQKNI